MKSAVILAIGLLLGCLPLYATAQVKPDLVVVEPYSIPTLLYSGATYPFSATIRVQGTNGSQFNCIGYYLSGDATWDATDAYLGSSCRSLMFPGESGTCAINGTIPPLTTAGTYYVLLVADPLNAERELDETNNVVSVPVTVVRGVTPLPDLLLWRPSLSFGEVPAGGSTGAFTFMYNRGAGETGAYELGFYLSADTVFSAGNDVFLDLLANGINLTMNGGTIHSAPVLTIPATTAPGTYYLLLVADPRNRISESDETNNSRALPLRVAGTVTATAASRQQAIEVYPNPADNAGCTVRWAGAGLNRVEVFNSLGQLVGSAVSSGASRPEVKLDTQRWVPGMYTLRLFGRDGQVATQQLLCQ
ncbi:hypothetical protein HNQ93_000496 [Hymenobacter luteus]|uniref:T9SS type A sorting domain-containing protein n=2 Tax=Hymenobacter TaxID=89966 RepID=A0A7W9WAU6_9BACT|nr:MULTISPECIES: CARDB domain-containing protein [Hymenobacter]MBB4600024.1 hypothetical protein [Hymenobacter latericoloratus]MBB6057666.1 hypothetical protein [Hymenobacter luteus]